MALSNKEKNMIYGCCLLAVFTAAYLLVISPLNTEIEALTEERDIAEDYLSNVSSNAGLAVTYEKWLGETKTDYLKNRERFEDVYATEDADSIFTEEVLLHGMIPMGFSAGERRYGIDLMSYNAELFDENGEPLYNMEDGLPYSGYIYVKSINFTCEGTFEKALEFTDTLKNKNGVIINSIDFTPEFDQDDKDKEPDYSDREMTGILAVSFDIYNYDKEGFERDNSISFN